MLLTAGAFLLALLAQAGSTFAAENRIEFLTVVGETRVEHSEVCFFPADANDAFFNRFLSTNDVRCLSADAVINLPPGLFNVYARNGSALIDSHPTFIDNEHPGEPGYRKVELELSPAATLDVGAARTGLRDGEWLVVYLTNDGRPESLASVHPVPDHETKMLVPAGMALVPMVVRRGAIVRVGRQMQLRAGETMSLPKVNQWGSGRDVVALLRTDALTASDVPPRAPAVELHGGTGEPLRPMFAPRSAGRFERSLAIFKDVPAGVHQIRLSGEGWQTDESPVTITSAATAVTAVRPLHARIAATLEVRASIGELARVSRNVRCPGTDAPEASEEARPTLRLLRCDDGRSCTTVRERPFDPQQSDLVMTWSDLVPGAYVAELAYRFLDERSGSLDVQAGKPATLTVALHADTVTGRVTHGASPVQAAVSFDYSIAPALSDESGNYTAFVGKEPQRSVVTVRLCGGGAYKYRPESPIGKVLDIDVPKNELVVRVVDEGGRPLAGASVNGGPMFSEGDGVDIYLPFPPTDAAGETRFRNVVTDAVLQLCAGAPGHPERCAEELRMGKRAFHRIEIPLRRVATMGGRLLAGTPILGGMIWLVSPNGAIVDGSTISPEGEFTLRKPGAPGEYLVSDSLSHSLVVFELPAAADDRPLELEMPAQSRALNVVLSPQSPRRSVALELAGRVIPTSVLVRHQMMRRLIHELEPGETLAFRDLGPGSLAVYSVPVGHHSPPEWKGLDPVEHPHLRVALRRFEATGPVVHIE